MCLLCQIFALEMQFSTFPDVLRIDKLPFVIHWTQRHSLVRLRLPFLWWFCHFHWNEVLSLVFFPSLGKNTSAQKTGLKGQKTGLEGQRYGSFFGAVANDIVLLLRISASAVVRPICALSRSHHVTSLFNVRLQWERLGQQPIRAGPDSKSELVCLHNTMERFLIILERKYKKQNRGTGESQSYMYSNGRYKAGIEGRIYASLVHSCCIPAAIRSKSTHDTFLSTSVISQPDALVQV